MLWIGRLVFIQLVMPLSSFSLESLNAITYSGIVDSWSCQGYKSCKGAGEYQP